ncbi:hypothetical protein [Pseudophaeobacter sp. EL27]|uniref:hypothetical protein n=1 Tax=Pseudophaeobacter sp. EL27 TaxID=2107580 RepID=UPI000EFB99EE|nr:hypothetical protein [Pseudophaeobacter sp. EL27]
MRLYPLCLPLLLTGCFGPESEPVTPPPRVPPDLLQPCAGYTGPVPQSEGQISDALIAEARGRACANGRLATVAEILEVSFAQ